MKPPRFEYHRAHSASEAVELLARYGGDARVLAGGQSLVLLLNYRRIRPAHLVDVNSVSEFDYIRVEDGMLRIGAVARQRSVERSDDVGRLVPLLPEALAHVASPPVRHRGTVCGSVAHGDPSAEIPACMVALDAEIIARSTRGIRPLHAAEFFTGPHKTALRDDELVSEVRVPVLPERAGAAFCEFAPRYQSPAVVCVAALLDIVESRVSRASVAVAGVGAVPVRARRVEALLIGNAPTDELLAEAAEEAAADVDPSGNHHGSARFRRSLAHSLTRRALAVARGRATERTS